MKVCEIFRSIQGEGLRMGLPTVFVRTAGCPLHCSFCDTVYSFDDNVPNMSVAEVVAAVKEAADGCTNVVITGGEPCVQRDLADVARALRQNSFTVALETSGAFKVDVDAFDWIAVSPKPVVKYKVVIPWTAVSEFKYVVTTDFNFNVIPALYRTRTCVWLQPDGNHVEEAVAHIMENLKRVPGCRVGVQLHKVYHCR